MLYIIIEYIYYPESPQQDIVCIVDNKELAKDVVDKLSKSVEEYNESEDLYDVSYYYEEFELNNLDMVANFIHKNKEGNVYDRYFML